MGRVTVLVSYMSLRFGLIFGPPFMHPCIGEHTEPTDLGPTRRPGARRHVHGTWKTLFWASCTAHQGEFVGSGLANHTMPA